MFFRTRFNRLVVSPPFGGETLTQKQFAPECSINRMLQRFLGGDPSAIRHGRFGDFTNLPESLHEACNKVANANSVWENLPETLRATYGSPEGLLTALEEHERIAQASKPSKPSEPSETTSQPSDTTSQPPKKDSTGTELNV